MKKPSGSPEAQVVIMVKRAMRYYTEELKRHPGRLARERSGREWITTIESLVNNPRPDDGFQVCVNNGRPDMTFEYIVTYVRAAFSNETIDNAEQRLAAATNRNAAARV